LGYSDPKAQTPKLVLKAPDAGGIAVLVVAVYSMPDVQTGEAKTVTRALSNSTSAPNALAENRQAASVKAKLEM